MIQNMFVKAIIKEELAVIISKIREETRTDDDTPVKLKEAIQVGDWEMTRKDPEIAPFYPVKDELFIADALYSDQRKLYYLINFR